MKNNQERKYYILIILFIALYFAILHLEEFPPISTIISTTSAIIAAVTFWMQLRRTENLNEANFLMSLNSQFINNKELTAIEHKLELYYKKVVDGEDVANIKLGIDLEREHEDYQNLVNYLVYMESLSAIIQKNVMRLGVVDDLFAYRFFIAVNNPVIQELELLPYANYYRGCFRLSEAWTKTWRKAHRDIPLEHFSLYERTSKK